MAVDIFVSRCCWVAVDCEVKEGSFVQVTVVAGPPEEMQIRVLDAKSYSIDGAILGEPVIMHTQYNASVKMTAFCTSSALIDSSKQGHILMI